MIGLADMHFPLLVQLESAGLTKREEEVINNIHADHGFPYRKKVIGLGCYWAIGMDVIT